MTVRVLLLAALLAGCRGANVSGPKAYRVWCETDERFVGGWVASREEAERTRDAHLARWFFHAVVIRVTERADVEERLSRD